MASGKHKLVVETRPSFFLDREINKCYNREKGGIYMSILTEIIGKLYSEAARFQMDCKILKMTVNEIKNEITNSEDKKED